MSAARPFWRDALAPYARPRLARSLLDLATSVVPYLVLVVVMYLAVDRSPLLVLALSLPAAGFLLRTFIVFHDCAHGSFPPSKRANAWLGTALGLVVYESFPSRRHSHAVHHAAAADLDRRGVGDLLTLTVAEYRDLLDAAEEVAAPLQPTPPVIDRDAVTLGLSGVYSSFLKHARRIGAHYGIPAHGVLRVAGERRLVGGQEDLLVDIAVGLASERVRIGNPR